MTTIGGPRDGAAAAIPDGTVLRDSAGTQATITVSGTLDGDTGAKLLDAVEAELAIDCTRIDVDLRAITSFSRPGADSLARCRDLCAPLADGLHFRTDGGPDQLALLEAFASETHLDDPDVIEPLE